MARPICSDCQYPINNCLCDFLVPVVHETKVIVLQHPSEVKNAKNTVRLLDLISTNTEIVIGETEQDFTALKQKISQSKEDYAVLFPSDTAQALDSSSGCKALKHLIVIDGTWKKAKKIMLLNPWLNDLIQVSFAEDFDSKYQIRSTSVEGGLSTIEAVAYSLEKIENCSVSPFITALDGLKHSFTKRMPEEVKARYQQRE